MQCSTNDLLTKMGICAEIASAIKNHHDIMAHWDALLPGRVLHVPYEQLVEDQEG